MATDEEERLVAAARRGDLEEIRRLLRAGVDVNAKDNVGHMALIEAAAEGHPPSWSCCSRRAPT